MVLWRSSLSLLILRRDAIMTSRKRIRLAATTCMATEASLLAQAWSAPIAALADDDEAIRNATSSRSIQAAIERTIPLLEDTASVPFVCRYRVDVISPLNTAQVHHLQELLQKHASLESLRKKLLGVVSQNDEHLITTIQTTTSKSVLEDLYAPYKPPTKGSILEQIQKAHPELITAVDNAWDSNRKLPKYPNDLDDKVIHLVASKISAVPVVTEYLLEQVVRHCRIQTKGVVATSKKDDTTAVAAPNTYNDFACLLRNVRNHQVLAIERGISEKAIQLSYEIDADKMESCIRYHLIKQLPHLSRQLPSSLLEASIHQSWTKTLRRKLTARLWSEKVADAKQRAMLVFQQNLRRALLAPPLQPPRPLLALDPGFQAGIKCAVLDANGNVLQLDTIKFLGNREADAVIQLEALLAKVPGDKDRQNSQVLVALGNGHGSQEARALVDKLGLGQTVRVELVNEAGASVWSVTPAAKAEFSKEPPAAVAAISIGRRLQNPLAELVKVPPRSLGLGMYQHDMSEKELDEKLHLTSVDAVATVGVDCNSCSLEVLQKVPGLTKLAGKIVKKRPFKQRADLMNVPGLGPKTFENCAAFCRVAGPEPLDGTLVHPESYDIARFLLQRLDWKLSEKPTNVAPRNQWTFEYKEALEDAAGSFHVSIDRAASVLENLLDSMTQIDPRLRELQESSQQISAGTIVGCSLLAPEFAASDAALQTACPVRNVIGTVRNIVDFGAFVDFGGHNDGLVHTSKLGPVRLDNLLIGQQIGVDILSVATGGKIELAPAGLSMVSNTPHATSGAAKDTAKGQQVRNISTAHAARRPSQKRTASTSATVTKRHKTTHS